MNAGDGTSDAERAEALYVAALASGNAREDWRLAVTASRRRVFAALKATNCLRDIPAAITHDGTHVAVLRHMLAPPISQDQFALLCPGYSKTCEKPGKSFSANVAVAVASTALSVRDRSLTRWLDAGRSPTRLEVRLIVHGVAPLLSQQIVSTVRRHRLSTAQEGAVVEMLEGMGWQRIVSGVVDQSSALPLQRYMHKTRFATKTRPQEVDIACGLGKSVVLAMECKVTNDRTNSVKRINDILKKATAWQDHWGSFVRTAALLQGVIAQKDVNRLSAAGVEIFWSHDLQRFAEWLSEEAHS